MQPMEPPRQHAPFQIDDDLYLELHAIEEGGSDATAATDLCHGLLQLRELSHQGNHLLAGIRKHHSDIGHYLSLLDRKLELLTQMVADLAMGGTVTPSHRVKLGPEGIEFTTPEPLNSGTLLRLRLILFPSHQCLQLLARVMRCEVQPSAGHLVELQFEQVEELQQDALIRHLLEKQSAALRQQRDS